MNTWIFQANPDRFDVDAYLVKTKDISWLVAKEVHARRMRPGDRVFLWRAKGKVRAVSGMIASGQITDTPSLRIDDPAAIEFWVNPAEAKENLRVGLRVDRVADADQVLTRKALLADPILQDLPHFKMAQGTNWELSPEQAARLEGLWDSGPLTAENTDWRFGAVGGVLPGTVFANRRELSDTRVHRPLQAGICGSGENGAESIVLSGGYEDDVDEGDLILYTGHGGNDPATGKQISDQEFTRQNKALEVNKERGIPVRVVRGPHPGSPHAPTSGYRYDGLYLVEDSWLETGKSGYRICRFRLVRFMVDSAVQQQEVEPPAGPAGRRTVTSDSIVRDPRIAERVKRLHNHQCQACGIRLATWGGYYAEAAHIRGLGRPHDGPDVLENLICLCPNCHVLFDNGGLTVAEDLSLVGLPGRLRVVSGHRVAASHLEYHRRIKSERK